jgi:GA-binding protein transcription factor alpha
MSKKTFFNLLEHGVTVQFFDLEDPLSRFKKLLEELWQVSLADYSVWLQDTQQLDENKNLIEHCINGEGKVQIKLQLKMRDGVKMMNIIDVLKPTEEDSISELENEGESIPWIESQEFTIERVRRGIPDNIEEWNVDDVKFWVQWAAKTFNLVDVDIDAWKIAGREVKQMTVEAYRKLIPSDPDNQFWTHLQVLQKCGQVAVSMNEKKTEAMSKPLPNNTSTPNMMLCKFLLDLLVDKDSKNIVRWVNDEAEFKFLEPEVVAERWGKHRQKADMTYEKMARALRRHYANIISKVVGKKYVYKFDFDVREVLGYAPMELDKMLNEP